MPFIVHVIMLLLGFGVGFGAVLAFLPVCQSKVNVTLDLLTPTSLTSHRSHRSAKVRPLHLTCPLRKRRAAWHACHVCCNDTAHARLHSHSRMLLTLRVIMPTGNVLKTKLMPIDEEAILLEKYVRPFVAGCIDNVTLHEIVCCTSLEQLNQQDGVEVDIDDFQHLKGRDLSAFGNFLLIRCCPIAAANPPPQSLPSALQELLRGAQKAKTKKAPLSLPSRCTAARYDLNIFNALLDRLGAHHLAFTTVDANGSAQKLLMAVAQALSYLLPFDDTISEEKPRGILRARGLVLPDGFTTNSLGIEQRKPGHHQKPSDERLSRATIEEHADNMVRKLSACSWANAERWKTGRGKEFLNDITDLCNRLSGQAEKMKKNVEQVQHVQQATAPARSPADSELVDYYPVPKSSEPVTALYEPLNREFVKLGDNFLYQPIHVTDELMSIDPRSSLNVKRNARQKFLDKLKLGGEVGVYIYNGGGPFPRHVQVWAIESPVPQAVHAATVVKATANIQQYATRQMKREFIEKFAPVSMHPAVLRSIYSTLDLPLLPDQSKYSDVDERFLAWLSCNDVDAAWLL